MVQGDLTSGVMAGDGFLSLIPLNKSVLDQESGLCQDVVQGSSLPGQKWKVQEPNDWFDKAFIEEEGHLIWAPPPSTSNGCTGTAVQSVTCAPKKQTSVYLSSIDHDRKQQKTLAK